MRPAARKLRRAGRNLLSGWRGLMRFDVVAACGLAMLTATPAEAAVQAQTANGFTIEQTAAINAAAPRVFATILHPAQWWLSEHTYSGSAQSLRLEAKAGGCFCERWTGGEVAHMRVVQLLTNSRVRLVGGLGPLQSLADGALTFSLEPAPGGGTHLRLEYRVWGDGSAELAALAPMVDAVMGEQLAALKAAVEARSARP